MSARPFSLILLPTLDCNAACDYCFEEKSSFRLAVHDLPRLTTSILDHMETIGAEQAEVYWQGGEALLMGPEWFMSAHGLMGAAAAARGRAFRHYLQTNLIGYGPHWNPVIKTVFGGSIGTSMDFPNSHRRLKGGGTEPYTQVWLQAVRQAREAGFDLGVIAVLHACSLRVEPRSFLSFFTEEAGITSLQVNLPFPGGPSREGHILETAALSRFLVELLELWAADALHRGFRLGPFLELMEICSGRHGRLPCIWQPNCANDFLTVDPRGEVALCDCWVTSYPQHSFGNLFKTPGLSRMLDASRARRAFLDRPARLMDTEDCDACPHLAMCHGGCPIRTYTAKGTFLAKDPYCEVYKVVFEKCRRLAGDLALRRIAQAGGDPARARP